MQPILCKDIKTGKVIAVYESISGAARAIKVRDVHPIVDVCMGRLRAAYGYSWEYKNTPKKRKRKKAYTRKQAVKYMQTHPQKSYVQLSEATGLSVSELRKIYNEEKLYRSENDE